MKKIIILILFSASLLFAQRPHSGFKVQEKDSVGVAQWDLVTTDADTSEWYRSFETMTIYYGVRKWNATSDAPDITLSFQTTNSSKDLAVTDKTLTLSAADTSDWKITQSAIGNGMYWRIIATGGASNDSTRLELYFDGYPNISR